MRLKISCVNRLTIVQKSFSLPERSAIGEFERVM